MDRPRILNLLELLKSSSAAELAVQEGESYVRLRRRPPAPAPAPPAVPGMAVSAEGALAPGLAPGLADGRVVVTARLVGFFHRGQGPDAEPLVAVGDCVRPGQTIGTIESLRQMTAVTAPGAGTVLEIVATEHQPVQFGDALIILEPAEE
jgi:acetyl-CoA carboxylase biotin carboxyl carrier protein